VEHNWRITNVVKEFIEENGIEASIDIDEDEDSSFTIFSTASESGSLRTIINVDEESGHFMMYVIYTDEIIPKKYANEVLKYVNHINLHTKIGAFHIFKYEGDSFLRHYQGLLGDDMEIGESLIYNMLLEAVDAIQMRVPQLKSILHDGKKLGDIFQDSAQLFLD